MCKDTQASRIMQMPANILHWKVRGFLEDRFLRVCLVVLWMFSNAVLQCSQQSVTGLMHHPPLNAPHRQVRAEYVDGCTASLSFRFALRRSPVSMRTFVWSFVAWHILHAAATCDACDDWKLERFNAYPQTTDPCYIDDPDGFLRTEEDVRYALDVCREAAQYFKTQRVRGCEHAHVLSFKVRVSRDASAVQASSRRSTS